MKTATLERDASGDPRTGPARDTVPRSPVRRDYTISRLFRAYFNNKMTLLFFLIQEKSLQGNSPLVEGIFRFLDDFHRHMLAGKTREQYHHAFEWLKAFFRALPDVSQEEREQAKGFIRCLSHLMGMNLNVERECCAEGVPESGKKSFSSGKASWRGSCL